MERELYLRPNVFAEPLFNSWYAWPLLIAPGPAAMITANLHLRLLESFVAAPGVHLAAAKNPAIRGGPFIDYAGDPRRMAELLEQTRSTLGELLQFAAAVRDLDKLLAGKTGHSLEPLYAELPASLRGVVELGYDLGDRANYRLIEPLAYRSSLYKPEVQSLELRSTVSDDRSFVLSTPRIQDAGTPRLNLPFAAAEVDQLFASRHTPLTFEQVDDLAGRFLAPACRRQDLHELFTSAPGVVSADRHVSEPGLRIRYLGHATLLIQSRDVSILTDPIVPYDLLQGHPRYSYRDLPDRIDYVLLTHAHQDHVVFETLLQLRHKVGCWVVPRASGGFLQDPSLKWLLRTLGFSNVVELDELECIEIAGGRITGLPFLGEHGDLMLMGKLGYHVELESTRVLALADCNNLDAKLYENVQRTLGGADVVFIGMECAGAPMSWLYGPLFTKRIDRAVDQSRRLNGSNSRRAAALIRQFAPRQVFVYAMGQEPWLKFISSIEYTPESIPIQESDLLIEECRKLGIDAQRLYGRRQLHYPPGVRPEKLQAAV